MRPRGRLTLDPGPASVRSGSESTGSLLGVVEEVVDQVGKLAGVLEQEGVTRVGIKMEMGPGMTEHPPHQDAVFCRQQQILAACRTRQR